MCNRKKNQTNNNSNNIIIHYKKNIFKRKHKQNANKANEFCV